MRPSDPASSSTHVVPASTNRRLGDGLQRLSRRPQQSAISNFQIRPEPGSCCVLHIRYTNNRLRKDI